MLQQNVPRRTSWVMTWKTRQCNSVCYLHMWMPSVLQTCKHMYIFQLRIVRERADSKDCSSVPVLVAELLAIVDPSPWTEHLQRKSSTLQSRLRHPSMPTTTPSYLLGQLWRVIMKVLGDSFCLTLRCNSGSRSPHNYHYE